jgi:acyl carrier protein
MSKPLQKTAKSLEQLRALLAEKTGNDLEDIHPQSHLEDDLGINLTDDFPRLLSQINAEFEIGLDLHTVMDEMEMAGETVAELAKLIDDESELG